MVDDHIKKSLLNSIIISLFKYCETSIELRIEQQLCLLIQIFNLSIEFDNIVIQILKNRPQFFSHSDICCISRARRILAVLPAHAINQNQI